MILILLTVMVCSEMCDRVAATEEKLFTQVS